MLHVAVEFAQLLFAGILAGEEFAVCYALRGPLMILEPQPQIKLRQALIRRLRILVPAILLVTLVSGAAVMILNGVGRGFYLRCAGGAMLLVFLSVTLIGTVPINKAALAWQAAAPPDNWSMLVNRWERLDVIRCWAAVYSYLFFGLALAQRSV